MSTPYIGEIRLFAGTFAPLGWALCQGQLLPIAENDALFALIGTTYGGDGQNTFALPDLRGRVPIHQGQGPGLSPYVIGRAAGSEDSTLALQHMPAHRHPLLSAAAATADFPGGNSLGSPSGDALYSAVVPGTPLAAASYVSVGGNQPHQNMAPFLAMNYIIALFGIYPSQN
jgi:microcystin-dependent protein